MSGGARAGPASGRDVGRVEEGGVGIAELLEVFDEMVFVDVGEGLEGQLGSGVGVGIDEERLVNMMGCCL